MRCDPRQVRIRSGTSGFSYKAWKGPFYPEDLPAAKMLAWYAEHLPAVEINNTFYRLPRASVLEGWAQQVPESFRFAIKASRRITHFKRLKQADEETGYLLRTLESLGPRLGCVLFQLPPNLKRDLERLDAFLELLPTTTSAAFEFRHPSWADDEVFERLRARDFAWVGSDTDDEPLGEIPRTATWGYLRLRRSGYPEAAVADWAARIGTAGWSEAYAFFKHEDEGAAPRLARALAAAAEPAPVRAARPARLASGGRESA